MSRPGLLDPGRPHPTRCGEWEDSGKPAPDVACKYVTWGRRTRWGGHCRRRRVRCRQAPIERPLRAPLSRVGVADRVATRSALDSGREAARRPPREASDERSEESASPTMSAAGGGSFQTPCALHSQLGAIHRPAVSHRTHSQQGQAPPVSIPWVRGQAVPLAKSSDRGLLRVLNPGSKL